MSIKPQDFNPFTDWMPVHIDREGGEPNYIRDPNTGRIYEAIPEDLAKLICSDLAIKTPLIQTAVSTGFVVIRGLQLLVDLFDRQKDCREKSQSLLRGFTHILLTPTCILGLECSALYGSFLNGRGGLKLYAAFERVLYGKEHVLVSHIHPLEETE